MSNVVNLRQARKKKARSEKERMAEDNRVAFGRTKAEKTLTKAQKAHEANHHEAGKLDQKDE